MFFQAQACKSSKEALTKCPNGMYSEIKYDGERVQVHKRGKMFKYFSRSLKPVLPHKVRISLTLPSFLFNKYFLCIIIIHKKCNVCILGSNVKYMNLFY